MSFYSLTSRPSSSYTLPNKAVGILLKEDGDALLTESGNEILLENPVNNPNLSQRPTPETRTWDMYSWDEGVWDPVAGYTLPLRPV